MDANLLSGEKEYDLAELELAEKDEKMCEKIVGVLAGEKAKRVLLAGKAGIGKTRLAKLVGQYAIRHDLCFLTLCLHLNQEFKADKLKFEDDKLKLMPEVDKLKRRKQYALYQNIASQLSVYSDFEETEVDDRDEDEEVEKNLDTLLNELQRKIVEEIYKREVAAQARAEEINIKRRARKTEGVGKGVKIKHKRTPQAGAEKKVAPKRFLLLILDDEGNKTSEEVVMKELGLAKFLKEQCLSNDDTRLKIIVTKRNQDEKPGESDGSDSQQGDEEQEDAKDESEIESDGNTEDQPVGVPKHDGKGIPPAKLYEDIEFDSSDESLVLLDSINDRNLSNLFVSLISKEWKTDEYLISNVVKNSRKSPAAIVMLAKSLNQITRRTFNELKENILAVTHPADPGSSSGEPILHLADELFASSNSNDAISDNHSDSYKTLRLSLPEEWTTDENFISKIKERSNNPSALLNYLKQISGRAFSELKNKIAKELDKVIRAPEPAEPRVIPSDQPEYAEEIFIATDQPEPAEPDSSSESTINPIFHLAYVLLEKFGASESKDVILDCFWHSLDFFVHCGCVYYRDLITQWILEGYFDPVRSVEKAYQDGHSILLELINHGMLKIQENDMVVPEMAVNTLIDPRRRGHLGRSRLVFSRVYAGDKDKGIGKITQIDDMIKTVQAMKVDQITTVMVSGDRMRRVTPDKYFANLRYLEVLGLFKPTLDPFIPALVRRNRRQLRILVIRDCVLLDKIEELKELGGLQALEVSGSSSLKKISDDLFAALSKLQSLNLSGLQITSSPSSISELKELHCLIIRDCPLLEDLPDIQKLVNLEVVNISGARGLQTCFDNTKGETKNKNRNSNFYHLTRLQLLDFSESQIDQLPLFQDSAEPRCLHSLTRLLLRNCSNLRRLPSLKPLSGLQILDLSGTTSLVEMFEVCFEDKKELKTLNLSRTNLSELADTINELHSLNKLLLKDATNLETIPKIQDLTNLKVIDVSGSTKLKTIEGSFEKMHYLHEVNLSGTQVKDVPELPKESKIYCEKLITLADGTKVKGKDWDEVEAKIRMSKVSEEASTSEISEKKSDEVVEIQLQKPLAHALQVPKDEALYMAIRSASHPEGMEINGTNEIDFEALPNAEFVYFVNINSTRLAFIFEKAESVKGCWVAMCMDIEDLFSGVAEERLESLETLSITNLPSLETISCGGSLKNLKKLRIEYCPNIKAIFPEASQIPSSLEVVHLKHCQKLETIVEGGEAPAGLLVVPYKCLNYKGSAETTDLVTVDRPQAAP